MKPFSRHQGIVIPLAMNDVDTDLIIPAQHLTSVSQSGYGEHLFERLMKQSPDFVFNQPRFQSASILLTQYNFGCGSSREHAVWALQEWGIQVVIAGSFADIFANNSAKNGLLLITQPKAVIDKLITQAEVSELSLTVDLEKQRFTANGKEYEFEIDPFQKYCFIQGLDELDYLLQHLEKIKAFKEKL